MATFLVVWRAKEEIRRWAHLDRFYLPANSKLGMKQISYFIHGYSNGSDHSPTQLEMTTKQEELRKSTFN